CIAVAYEVRGKRYDEIPPGRHLLERVKPVYEKLPGWSEDVTKARVLDDLPTNAHRYLTRLAELCGVQLAMIGVGAAREATIVMKNPFAD
ncbi:MAG: adenylosuccinate synthetase, partial [Candidatus Binataceae bacterium]